jgi:hypothetical protein
MGGRNLIQISEHMDGALSMHQNSEGTPQLVDLSTDRKRLGSIDPTPIAPSRVVDHVTGPPLGFDLIFMPCSEA